MEEVHANDKKEGGEGASLRNPSLDHKGRGKAISSPNFHGTVDHFTHSVVLEFLGEVDSVHPIFNSKPTNAVIRLGNI